MLETMKRLACSGADGVLHEFVCVVSEGERVYDVMKRPPDCRYHWRYSVHPDEAARRVHGPHYFAEFVELADGRAISRDMQAPSTLRRLGIPDAVILDMATHHVVVSSSSRDPELLRGETQTADGP